MNEDLDKDIKVEQVVTPQESFPSRKRWRGSLQRGVRVSSPKSGPMSGRKTKKGGGSGDN